MRIVYFYPQFVYPAGTERIIIDKANYLAELYGYHVCLLTFQQGKHPFSYPLSDKVSHVDLDLPYDSLYRKNVLLRFWKWRHDLLTIWATVHQKHPDGILTSLDMAS